MPKNGRTPDLHAVDEVADLLLRIGSMLTDLEDLIPELLVSSRRELLLVAQLLDRVCAHAERQVQLNTTSG